MNLETAIPWAEGAGGRILKSRDSASGRWVAIKLVRINDAAGAARIRREAEAQSRLLHPNICPVLEVTEYNGEPAIVMPFIEGEPLDVAAERLTLRQRIELLLPVIDAVAAAHASGLVHRDLKPANILVERPATGDLHPWVLDFGIARAIDDATLTTDGIAIGTPGYMAPEQVRGEKSLDPRCDVYAFGVLLFRLLAGRLPLPAETPAQLMLNTATRDPPRLDALVPDLPTGIAAVAAKCLERDPAYRYRDAAELLVDLKRALGGEATRSQALGLRRRTQRFLQRNPGLALLGASAATLLLLLGAVNLWQSMQARERAQRAESVARELGQLGERFESRVKLVHAQPLRDISPQLGELNAWLDGELAASAPERDPLLARARDYALGRAQLALGHPAQALPMLQRAWDAGIRNPTLALRLAQAHFAVQAQEAAATRDLADTQDRLAALADIEQRHNSAAQAYLDAISFGDPQDAILAQGIQRYLQDDLEAAVDMLRDPDNPRIAWSVPGLMLAADLQFKAALVAEAQSDNARATALSASARNDFLRVTEMARSHPEAWLGVCRTSEILLALAWSGDLGDAPIVNELAEENFGQCMTVASVDPTQVDALIQAGGSLSWASGMLINRGQNPAALIEDVRALARLALASDPQAAGAHRLLGYASLNAATYDAWIANKENPDYESAVHHLQRARELAPNDLATLRLLARALSMHASRRYQLGQDGDDAYADAVETLRTASALPGAGWKVAKDLINTATDRAYRLYTNGRPAEPILEAAYRDANALLLRFPDNTNIQSSAAMTAWTMGQFRLNRGQSPEPEIDQAIALYEAVLAKRPKAAFTLFNLIGTYDVKAIHLQRQGQPVVEMLRKAETALNAIEALLPAEEVVGLQATVALIRGMDAMQRQTSPLSHLETARGLTTRMPEADGQEGLGLRARVATLELAWRCHNNAFDHRRVEEDRRAIEAGLDIFRNASRERALLGELLLEAASCAADHAAAQEWERSGRKLVHEAVGLDPSLGAMFGHLLASGSGTGAARNASLADSQVD